MHRFPITATGSPFDLVVDVLVSRVFTTTFASVVFRDQLLFYKLVEPVQIDVRHDRRSDPVLRRTGKRGVPTPVLQIVQL